MTPLHRHQIAWPSEAGWQRVLARPWDAQARSCLQHWAEHQLPVVVTRQPSAAEGIALGLSAPVRWQRRRLALALPPGDVLFFDEFPKLEHLLPRLARPLREPTGRLARALHRLGVTARVYGSHGWQGLTGLQHAHEHSDLDLWVGVASPAQADAVAQVLQAFQGPVRLDGELVFDGDIAASWREWLVWRDGQARSLLVKDLQGCRLVDSAAELEPLEAAA